MVLQTFEAEGLAQLSYLVGCDACGVAAVIDPRRDVDIYIQAARENGLAITHIIETHIHADFVSGALELQAKCGGKIYVGKAEGYGFDAEQVTDGQQLKLGGITLTVLHTPGHTPEHICLLARSGNNPPFALFSGDLLFAGEVGRPDLLGEAEKQKLARQLFTTFREKILTLDDGILVYPGHGEGSPCGGKIGDRRVTSIGYERANNPRLQIDSEDAFVADVLKDLPPPPRYYPRMKQVNACGPKIFGAMPFLRPVSAADLEARMRQVLVLDTREIEAYAAAHIPGSLSIPLRDEFPIWAGWMLDPKAEIILVLGKPEDQFTVQRYLFRIGIENVTGYLSNGLRSWTESGRPYAHHKTLSVQELHATLEDFQILDVRRHDEWNAGRVAGARHIYAPILAEELETLDRERPLAVYCGTGYRASIAASVLEQAGFRDVRNVLGSMKAWRAAGLPVER